MPDSPERPWQEQADGLVLRVLVQPRASRSQFCGLQGDELKLRLTAPPVDGAANACCQEFLAKLFRVPKSAVRIESGESSRHKRIRVLGATAAQLEQALGN
ncbi:MAG: DUF167 family protein [Trichlorobacter sp.]|jgi:hypothetical protein